LSFEALTSASSQDEFDVTFITPLVGFEYGAFDSLSFGFEIGASIMDGSFIDGNNANNNDDIDAFSIHSALVLRYHAN
jgi:hypothetical protein